MTKVTFLTGEYPPMQGGIADHTAYLAEHLAPLGIESSVLISRRWQSAHASTHFTSPLNQASNPPIIHPSISNWGWRCWPDVVNFLKTYQPHVLHIQYQAAAFDLGGWVNWLPWFLKKRGVASRNVTTFHDLRLPYIFPKAGSFRWRSILALAHHSDAVICTNREDLQILQKTLPLTRLITLSLPQAITSAPPLPHSPAPLLALIPLGSNVESQPPADFERTVWRKKYQADEKTLLLAYFGFLNESKGGEELIEALALLRQQGFDARLLLIGGDIGHADPTNVAYAQKIQVLIDQCNLADFVHRTGYTGLPEVSANLLAADAVVMPYRDGVSFRRTTLIAALRHGCPVISAIPADPTLIPEIQPGENMLLAPPRDAAALAQAIASLAGNPALRQKIAQGSKNLGDLFEWDKIARETAALYHRLSQ
ncbi:MAG TPA: glycosyltransferase family 4 protein [Anaerolineae bacterium]|nr:glycosyltransferase family 4 protein [Anaerolineae bacterium]